MKFSDTLRLATRNLTSHKARSVIIILTVALLFGLIIGVNFAMSGLRETLLTASAENTGGSSYVVTRYSNGIDSTKFNDYIKQSHGEILGKITDYSYSRQFSIASADAFKQYIIVDLSTVPEDKVPALMPANDLSRDEYAYYYEEADAHYFEVGRLPEFHHVDFLCPGDMNIFNFPLSVIRNYSVGWTSYSNALLLDDGSGRADRYIESKDNAESYSYTERNYLLVRFSNFEDLTKFISHSNMPTLNNWLGDKSLSAQWIFSDTASIAAGFITIDAVLSVVEIILAITAVFIAAFTFSHLIDQDAATVSLYRTLGASTGEIYRIYLIYLFELCLLAIFASILIGLLVVAALAGQNSAALARGLRDSYNLATAPSVILCKIDWRFYVAIAAILIVAPLALMLSKSSFSSQRIARMLKEQE